MLRGIDVSSHQPDIDWAKVKAAGNDFAVVKCTGGATYANPNYREQVAGARAAGLVVGHYHFAHEGANPGPGPITESQFFLDHADVQPGEFAALDIEDTGITGDLSMWAWAWLHRVEKELNHRPFVYSFPDYLRTRGLLNGLLAYYPLWYAYYKTPYATGQWPKTPTPWAGIEIWQWSGGTQVPGIPNDTDENLFDGTRVDLAGMGRPSVTVLTEPAAPTEGITTPAQSWGEGSKGIVVFRAETIVAVNEGKRFLGLAVNGQRVPLDGANVWKEL